MSHSSIQEIADSTESTAEAIQKQAAMCVDIQGNTDNAESGIKAMIDASRQTDETVKQGADVVEELKEQAHNVAEASNVTVSVIQSLTAKVEDVKSLSIFQTRPIYLHSMLQLRLPEPVRREKALR